mmetsp:Transcript_12882/g.39634  ORF Transcript_12882/g.39634 Transcript_12882/m.39634 type:complete len:180 (+) Transcript_12882:1110-1649(+)
MSRKLGSASLSSVSSPAPVAEPGNMISPPNFPWANLRNLEAPTRSTSTPMSLNNKTDESRARDALAKELMVHFDVPSQRAKCNVVVAWENLVTVDDAKCERLYRYHETVRIPCVVHLALNDIHLLAESMEILFDLFCTEVARAEYVVDLARNEQLSKLIWEHGLSVRNCKSTRCAKIKT